MLLEQCSVFNFRHADSPKSRIEKSHHRHESTSRQQQHIDLLRKVRTRAETTLGWAHADLGLLDIALDQLTLGRTWLLEAEFIRSLSRTDELKDTFRMLSHATTHLNESVSLLRQACQQDEIPRGLLNRAGLWRVMLEECSRLRPSVDSSRSDERRGLAATSDSEPESATELLAKANKDLSEAETIAERGSMLIWRIEAAIERTRLYLMLAQSCPSVDSVSLCFEPTDDEENTDERRTQSDWLELTQEKLDETIALVKKTESEYEPYEHMHEIWEGTDTKWEPPSYVGLIKKGEIVGYHCRNEEIIYLATLIRDLASDHI